MDYGEKMFVTILRDAVPGRALRDAVSRMAEPLPRAAVTVVCAQVSMALSPYVPCGSRLDLKLVDGVVVGARGASRWAGAGVSSAAARYHFLQDGTLLDAPGSRHRTHPAHAGVCGHRTTAGSLEPFIDVTTAQPTPTLSEAVSSGIASNPLRGYFTTVGFTPIGQSPPRYHAINTSRYQLS